MTQLNLNSAIEEFLEKYSMDYSNNRVSNNQILDIIQKLSRMKSEGSNIAEQATYTEQLILNKLFLVMNNCLSLSSNPKIDLEWKDPYHNLNQQGSDETKKTSNSNLGTIAVTAIVAGALPMPLIGIPAGLGAGYMANKFLDKPSKNKPVTDSSQTDEVIEPKEYISAQVNYDSNEVKKVLDESLSAIVGTFSLIDERIKKEVEEKSSTASKLQDVPDILPFMQQFLAYIQSQKKCPDNLEILGDTATSILNNHGVQTRDYDESTIKYFNISYGKLPEDKNYRQMMPALTVDEKVICKGQVLIEEGRIS